MTTEPIATPNAPERSIEQLIADLRASVKEKVPGADDAQATQIIHEVVAGGIK